MASKLSRCIRQYWRLPITHECTSDDRYSSCGPEDRQNLRIHFRWPSPWCCWSCLWSSSAAYGSPKAPPDTHKRIIQTAKKIKINSNKNKTASKNTHPDPPPFRKRRINCERSNERLLYTATAHCIASFDRCLQYVWFSNEFYPLSLFAILQTRAKFLRTYLPCFSMLTSIFYCILPFISHFFRRYGVHITLRT